MIFLYLKRVRFRAIYQLAFNIKQYALKEIVKIVNREAFTVFKNNFQISVQL